MKCLQFNFAHPVKGHALLTRISADQSPDVHTFKFDSRDSNELTISLDGVTDGKWKIILEWEYEEKYFTHTREFDLPSENTLFPAPMFANASLFHSKGTHFSTKGKYAAADSEAWL